MNQLTEARQYCLIHLLWKLGIRTATYITFSRTYEPINVLGRFEPVEIWPNE